MNSTLSTTANNEAVKSNYIFMSHFNKGATLINTSDNDSIEQLNIEYNFYGTFQSMVVIDECIYVFGGQFRSRDKWMKYSIKSKSIEYTSEMIGIDADYHISACYDGQDHIYLVNGFKIMNRIDRFNIKTMKFERYHQFPKEYGEQISTMIYNGKLYSVSFNHKVIIEFDLTNKTTLEHRLDIKSRSACHDNNGNFYIHSKIKSAKFIRYNVISKQTTNLNPILKKEDDFFVFIQYQYISPNESYIYSFGNYFRNYKYSIERNQSKVFLENDEFRRIYCGSQSLSI